MSRVSCQLDFVIIENVVYREIAFRVKPNIFWEIISKSIFEPPLPNPIGIRGYGVPLLNYCFRPWSEDAREFPHDIRVPRKDAYRVVTKHVVTTISTEYVCIWNSRVGIFWAEAPEENSIQLNRLRPG